MARAGITALDVNEAAEQLLHEGHEVTVKAVRERIGSGSFSTINVLLGQWRDGHKKHQTSDVPPVPDNIARAMQTIWASAWLETQNNIRAEREGLEAARRQMEQQGREMTSEIARLEADNESQAEQITTLTRQLQEKSAAFEQAGQEITQLKIDNARLDERAKAAEQRATELKQELAELHQRLKEISDKPEEKPKETKAGKNKPSTDQQAQP